MPKNPVKLLAALRSPDAYPHTVGPVEVIETHISWVVLTGGYAYKIKKPVELPFLDFSTLAQREHFCREELRLNSRFAPEIYLDVVPIGGSPAQPRIGATPAIEYAVRMKQFDRDATADRLIGKAALSADDVRDLAARLAAFHRSLDPAKTAMPETAILENLDELTALSSIPDATTLGTMVTRVRQEVSRLRPVFAARLAAGAVRECHGDLHLGNVARIGERLLPFDCLEFDPALRTVDVIDEVAFLFMDLLSHDRGDLAYALLNQYLAVTGDYDGLRLLPVYAAHRALVRAKVAAISARETDAAGADATTERYRRTAQSLLSDASGRLLITCGLSGSGKSTVARELAQTLGAIHVRSDIERKRLCGVAPLARTGAGLNQDLYGAEMTDAVYRALHQAAAAALEGRQTVIADATFLERKRRKRFQDLATATGASFRILHCVADERVLRERIRQRAREGRDPSDADEPVLEQQLASAESLDVQERAFEVRIETVGAIDARELAAAVH